MVAGATVVVAGATVVVAGATVVVAGAIGVTALEAADEADVPPPFVAVALNVYDVPFVSPVTVQSPDEPVTVHVKDPGVEVTRYDVGEPPVPAATVTSADASPATAVGVLGVPGISG